MTGLTCMTLGGACFGQEAKTTKTFIDYFLPTPITGSLSKDVWGAQEVGPRDAGNGLEDSTMTKWSYWDGQIIKAADGKYHMFASRWDQAKGHGEWPYSKAVHAVSDKLAGPYVDKGLCWPDNQGGRGHNVTALVLPDGRYGVVISETRPGTVFVSKSLDGPWQQLGIIKGEGLHASNISIMLRPDGDYMIVPRSGQVFISKAADGILGPYKSMGPSAFPEGIPNLEDPCIFYSGGLYHIVVNSWSDRKAYHLTSQDGKSHWVNRGVAYDQTRDFVRYTDGTVNHWHKLERPGVLVENGHVTAMTFAALDTPKDDQSGNNGHGSKIIVVPFDGAALDRHLQSAAATADAAKPLAAASVPAVDTNCFANDTGPFKPTVESLKQYQYPEWFRDAKLGFWAHWGPQAVPRQGDWYARAMYESRGQIDPKTGKVTEASDQYRYHVAHYGHPSVFGYKDIIPLWKAERWDPDRLMALYKKAGAKYFVSMGSHHDNFFLWDSKVHRWNAAKMGPQRDVVGDWQKAAQKAGLRFGVSEHIARNSHWYGPSHGSDASGSKAGVPYDGNDPANQDLYGPSPIPGDDGWTTNDPAGQRHWAQALQEIIDLYHPDLIYSDSDLPFGNNRELGRRMLAHYYNQDLVKNGGNLQAVYTAKTESLGIFVRDIERGVDDRIAKYPWQTDTSIGDWYYRTGQRYKSAGEVIQMLADIVSKNGSLLLNIVQTPEGDLEPDVIRIVNEIGDWTSVNGESIYGTRPWIKFGEGPTAEAVVGKSAMYNEGNVKYTAKDIRFTQSKDGKVLYAIALGWPTDGKLTVKSLAGAAGTIKAVSLLGHEGKLDWTQTAGGLVVGLPAQKPCEYAFALKIVGDHLQPVAVTAPRPLPLTGVNLSGGEWQLKPNNGEYFFPTKAEIDYFAGQGMNVFRYPFRWETVQTEPRAPLDKPALARLKESVKFATARKLIVILDPHNCARYNDNIVGASKISAGDFADFWGRLAAEFKNDPYVWLGLVNEPHDMSTRLWFEDANAAIAAIRAAGAKNMILVPGNHWSGAHSWTGGGEESNAKWALTVKDPLNHWAIEVHQYVDGDSSGTQKSIVSPTIGAERLKSFVKWCRQNHMHAVLGEFGVPVVPTGEETLHNMLQSMEQDRDVWLGWTWWAAGSRWGDYLFSIEPRPDGSERPQMAWLRPHLNGTTTPKK